MQYMVDVAELRKLMAENGYNSISSLADVTGFDRNTVGDVVNGKKYPSSKLIGMLIKVLNIPLDKVGVIFFAQKLA